MSHPRRVSRAALLVAVFALSALTVPGGVPGAQAAENGAWSVKPTPAEGSNTPRSYFILEGAPGDVIRDSVRIQNWTKKPISFRLFGADGFNTEAGGFFALKNYDDKQVELGSWVKPTASVVTVYGRTQVDVPLKIRIPKNATPGDHVGGVVAMNVAVESQKETGAVDVGIQRAVGARAYVRVSGTISPGIEVSGVRVDHDRGALPWSGSGKGEVSWTVENTGNARLSPETTITVDGLGEKKVADIPKLVDLIPGQKIRVNEKISGISWIGSSDVTVKVDAGDGLVDSVTVSVWAVPWVGLLGGLLLLAALVALALRRSGVMQRKLKAAENAPKIEIVAEETV